MVSCEKEDEILEAKSTENKVDRVSIENIEVKSENGYLVLNSISDANQLAFKVNNLGQEGAISWSKYQGIR